MSASVRGASRIDIPRISVGELVLAGLDKAGDRPVLIDGITGASVSARDTANRIRAFAGALAANGMTGKVVAIMSPNTTDYPVLFHGILLAGAVATTVNPSYTAEELRFQLKDSGAVLLIVHPAFLVTAMAATAGLAIDVMTTVASAEARSVADLSGPPLAAQVPIDWDADTAVIPYSSGTTGLPKGVMLTHRNLVANVEQIDSVAGIGPEDVTLAILPFFHIYGLTVLMNLYLSRGAALVTLPRFDLEAALRLIETHRVQRFFVAPPVILALAKHPIVDNFDLSSLSYVLSGAAPLGEDLAEACAARIGCPVVQGYGMTELSPVATMADHRGKNRPGSVGRIIPLTELRLADPETGRDAEKGHEGEVCVRGPQAMKGYLNRPEATAAMVDKDGWVHTGDIGWLDEDGYLFVRDRVKELIKVKGFQVAPAEIEALLLTHPSVADCAVVGRTDAESGEVPVAYVVCAKDQPLDPDAIKAHVARSLATYKHLADVHQVEAIPKSPSGKILRRLLRQS